MIDWFTGIFAGIGAFFVFGTIWFWVVSAAAFGLLTFWTEKDNNFLAGIFAIGFIWITASVNGISILANPMLLVQWSGIYLVAGTVWSFLKWFSFLHSEKDELRKIKQHFLNSNTSITTRENGTFSDADFTTFAQFFNDNKDYARRSVKNRSDLIPTVGEHRSELIGWIVWWPFSAFWTLLNDPLRRLANFVVDRFRGAYESLASRVFKNEI